MATTGTATLNFGAFPGSSHATVAVTGQGAIVAGSLVEAWIRPVASADHSSDEHMVETLKVFASDIVAGVGFTIHGFNTSQLSESLEPGGGGGKDGVETAGSGHGTGYAAPERGGRGTLIYGAWTIAWVWL